MPSSRAPSSETLRRARLFWEQSQADLRSARSLHRSRDYVHSSFLSLQAVTNGLSAVCHLHGHFQLPTGGPTQLLALCAQADAQFASLELAHLERAMERNPFAPDEGQDPAPAFSQACLAEGEAVIESIQRYLKANKSRFFAP